MASNTMTTLKKIVSVVVAVGSVLRLRIYNGMQLYEVKALHNLSILAVF
jgi:hypothetical protein